MGPAQRLPMLDARRLVRYHGHVLEGLYAVCLLFLRLPSFHRRILLSEPDPGRHQ